MNNYKTIIGVDVSKLKLDVVILQTDKLENYKHFVVTNDKKGILKVFNKIEKDDSTLFCFEHTGNYNMPLCCLLEEYNIDYWVAPAIDIKRSKGFSRNKSDKTDAIDIGFYAYRNLHKVKLNKLPNLDIQKIKLLLTERDKLVKAILLFSNTKEASSFLPKNIIAATRKINDNTLILLKKQLNLLEKEIESVVKENETISKQMELTQSIPGIGKQTSINLIVKTNCFSSFDNSRQFACYSGIAPFEYSSGSSVKGRTKVSHIADKKMKALINIASLSAKKYDSQMKEYYQRKIKEGKNPMLVMNNIRNKLVARVFAVINRGTPFVDTQKFHA